jgi:hypothetical protein
VSKPPYGSIAATAKHGTDADLLAMRDQIRWLGRWTDDIHSELATIWRNAEIVVGPINNDDERKVSITLTLSSHELATLLHILDEDTE